jgi:tetratricopeptide (TPR) repeat protein
VAALVVAASSYLVAGTRSSGTTAPGSDRLGDPTTVAAPAGPTGQVDAVSLDQIDRAIAAWSANLRREPRDFLSATNLASLYHGRGQLTGSINDHDRALQAVGTALEAAPTYAPARALDAAIRYTLHDFAGALAVAAALYAEDRTQLGALATKADAELELGRIDDARRDLGALAAQAAGPAVDVRLARLAFVTGDHEESVRLANRARAAAMTEAAGGGPSDAGFYAFAAGEFSRITGDATAARDGYQVALAIRPTDLGALLGLARLDAYEGDLGAAIDGLRTATAIAPQPEAVALLGDLLAASDDGAGAAEAYKTVRFIARLGSVQGAVYDRALVRFELDHEGASPTVLEAARASTLARPDAAGHDLLAWALYRLGRFDEAATEIDLAGAYGSNDARLRFHQGAIALALGDRSGRSLIEGALADGPALDPIERVEAERLAAE